MLRVLIFYLFH